MKMRILIGSMAVLVMFILSACQSTRSRNVASTQELVTGSGKVLNDLLNPQIFNPQTCPVFLNQITNYLFHLPADYFIPKTAQEEARLKDQGPRVMDTIFQIRVVLHEKLQEFDARGELKPDCILKVREGFQYARFAEEYLLEWLHRHDVYSYHKTPILSPEKPSTWTNEKFSGFTLQSGDVLLVRGKSYVSAMIARIADEEGNFSHLAIVGEDKTGKKYIVESLIQYGVIVTPLEKWLEAEDARVALFRHPDTRLAKSAARKIYDKAQTALNKKKGIRYDFSMDDDDYSTLFCSEVIRYAYDMASGGKVIVPKYRSSVGKFKDTDYPRSLGVTKTTLFAPYDIEVDPRFDFIAEYRFYPLLRQVRMQDAVLQSVYSWMIHEDYTFKTRIPHVMRAYFAKIVRQFGIAKDTLPTYMPIDSITTNVKFEAVAKVLEQNIYKVEKELYEKNGYLPSFQDMLQINEEFRREDCARHKEWLAKQSSPSEERNEPDTSQFHWFFASEVDSCPR
ncbi:MAG: YiiX/YebB-like N1pC/P60 family cysteine hydrolase [Bdellovibrio sp.]